VRGWILLLLVIGLARGVLYARLVPLWQGPDEPRHYEYARLMGQLGRVPTRGDTDPQMEQEILRSLREHRFWAFTGQPTPEILPAHLADDPWLSNAGTQIGGESPLYYVVPALLTTAFPDIERQAHALRVYSVSLYTLTILAIAIGSRALFRRDALLHKGIPLFVALTPMPTFVGSIINNDALANLSAATFFAVLASTWPRRWRLPQVSAILASLAIAVLAKRTCWFLVPTAVVAFYIHEPQWRPGVLLRRPVVRRLLIAALTVAVGLTLAVAWQNPGSPAHWRLNPERAAALRLAGNAHNGTFSLLVEDDDAASRTYASQVLPESRILGRAGKEISAQVWVKGLRTGTTACILLDDGLDTTSACVEPSGAWQSITVRHTVAVDASYLRVVLAVGDRGEFGARGSFLADDVTLGDDGGPIPLANAGFEAAASPLMAWMGDLAARLQWPAGLWHGWFSAASYAPAHLRRYALYVALTFAHFWGDFGWLQLPLPIGWYVALAAVSGLSLLGLIRGAWQAAADKHKPLGPVSDRARSGRKRGGSVKDRPQPVEEAIFRTDAHAGRGACPESRRRATTHENVAQVGNLRYKTIFSADEDVILNGSESQSALHGQNSEESPVAEHRDPSLVSGPSEGRSSDPLRACPERSEGVTMGRIFRASVRGYNGWLTLMLAAALFALAATFLPMIGQRWQPQGRYLFPALTPLVTLLIAGLRMWLPRQLSPRGQRLALAGWIALLFALDQAALWGVLYRAYY